ncbi:hypothetical protein GOV04_03235 [Candidatus Woesearchaeota archaeon]|nr:hypothetical protein [Candidatus Woesearchaeota archaeon]
MILSYEEAYSRNYPLINLEEQEILKESTVAIMGLGGVGGIQAVSLARTGIENFRIADPQSFQASDLNRQYGAKKSTLEKNKALVMKKLLEDINPFANVIAFCESDYSLDDLLEEADVVIDAMEYFGFDKKMELFRKAREKNLYTLSGPIPLTSAALFIFSPNGMTAQDYFRAPKDLSGWPDYKIPIERFYPQKMSPALEKRFEQVVQGKASIPTLSTTATISSGLLAYNTIKILIGKTDDLIVVPDMTLIDLENPNLKSVVHNPP